MCGPSAWELVCHASLTGVLQVSRHLRLPASGRRVPVLASSSGTQRAWPLLVRLRAGLRCWRRWVHLSGGGSGAFLAAIAARSSMRIRCAGKPGRHDIRNFRISLPGAPMSTHHALAFSSPVTSTAAARIFAPGTPAAASLPRQSPSIPVPAELAAPSPDPSWRAGRCRMRASRWRQISRAGTVMASRREGALPCLA
jgi:hypothetical protein